MKDIKHVEQIEYRLAYRFGIFSLTGLAFLFFEFRVASVVAKIDVMQALTSMTVSRH